MTKNELIAKFRQVDFSKHIGYLEVLNQENEKHKINRKIGFVIVSFIAIALFLISYKNVVYSAGLILVYGYLVSFGPDEISNTRKEAKNIILSEFSKAVGFTFLAAPESQQLNVFFRLNLIPWFNRSYLEDGLSGEIDGVEFTMFEARLMQVEYSITREYETDVFEGLLVSFDFPKKIREVTIVNKEVKFLRTEGSSTETVNLEESDFSKKFWVTSSDQVEASIY